MLGMLAVVFLAGIRCATFQPRPVFTSKKVVKAEKKSTVRQKKEVKKNSPTLVAAEKPVRREKSPSTKKTEPAVSFEFRQAVMQAIDDYLGTPYKWGGEDVRGMDCSGFVRAVYRRAANLNLPHSVAKLAKAGKTVSLQNLRFGDLIFFRKPGSGKLFHVGIYLGSGNFAHASTQNGVTISKLTEKYYKNRVAFGRRVLF